MEIFQFYRYDHTPRNKKETMARTKQTARHSTFLNHSMTLTQFQNKVVEIRTSLFNAFKTAEYDGRISDKTNTRIEGDDWTSEEVDANGCTTVWSGRVIHFLPLNDREMGRFPMLEFFFVCEKHKGGQVVDCWKQFINEYLIPEGIAVAPKTKIPALKVLQPMLEFIEQEKVEEVCTIDLFTGVGLPAPVLVEEEDDEEDDL